MKRTSILFRLKLVSAALLIPALVTNSLAETELSQAEQKFLEKQPNAVSVSPGVYSVSSNDAKRTYAFGTDGMVYTIQKLDELILKFSYQMNKEEINSIESAKAQLEHAYYSRMNANLEEQSKSSGYEKAANSGSICSGAIDYDLTATASAINAFYLFANATAGFLQSGAGPGIPDNALLYTFARAFDASRPLTNLETDLASFSPNGFVYVSADPSYAAIGPSSQCMESEAMAYIYIGACGDFESVSESFDRYCP